MNSDAIEEIFPLRYEMTRVGGDTIYQTQKNKMF